MPDSHTVADIPTSLVEQLRAIPTHDALVELCEAARDAKLLAHADFKKLVAYMLEIADGRDRREPWTTRPGDAARPVAKLRVQMESCFGVYADLHWFKLNKTANRAGRPLRGLFPRMAASLSRATPEDFADLVRALISPTPDASLVKFLQERGGKAPGIGVEIFSRLAYAFRRDLYFAIPKEWGEASGCLDYIGGDLRKYCGLCRNLRGVCDELGFPKDVRASLLNEFLTQSVPPKRLSEALHKAMGPAISRFGVVKPDEAYRPSRGDEDLDTLPTDFAAASIRARRGRTDLRKSLIRSYGDRCVLTGNCPRHLLEVGYVVPFPEGVVHGSGNALLMRSDVHTLWDLNLLGIEPESMQVMIAPELAGTVYAKLAGRSVLSRLDGSNADMTGLVERWQVFTAAHPGWEALHSEREAQAAAGANTHADSDESSPTVETTGFAGRTAGTSRKPVRTSTRG